MIDGLTAFLKLAQEFGPAAVIVFSIASVNVFFIWQSARREERQAKHLSDMQEKHELTIIPLVMECKEAISSSREVIKQNSQLLMSWISNHAR